MKTFLEVDLSSLIYNLELIREAIGSNRVIIAVIKAGAYGLGMEEVAKVLLTRGGINFFAVALVKEGIALRKVGIEKEGKILLLSPFLEEDIPDIIKYKLTPSIISLDMALLLDKEAFRQSKKISIHIKIDTGMGRLGIKEDGSLSIIKEIQELKNIHIEGIYSHFASADIPDTEFTALQIRRFREIKNAVNDNNILFHMANSSGIIAFPNSHFDGVRPGLVLYGAYPSSFIESKVRLKKVIKLKSKLVSIKTIKKGESVSYGRTFIAKTPTRVGILPLGYADGFSTLLSNKGEVIINDRRAKVIGRVCMDYTMIDLSEIGDVSIGDTATIIGDGITEEEIARKTGLIPYEILTSIATRVDRVYLHS